MICSGYYLTLTAHNLTLYGADQRPGALCDRYPNRVLCLKVGEATSVSVSDAEMSIMPRVRQNLAPFIPWSQRAHCGHRDRASHTAGQRHWAKWHLVTHPLELCAIRRLCVQIGKQKGITEKKEQAAQAAQLHKQQWFRRTKMEQVAIEFKRM